MDDVHDLMDDISEQNELAQEISEALTQGVGAAQDIDEVGNEVLTKSTTL